MEDNVKLFFNRLDYLKNSSDRIVVRSSIVRNFLGEIRNSKILDIGCGDGSLSLHMLHETNQLTLVDISDQMIDQVSQRIPDGLQHNVRLINDSFEAVCNKEQFDIILCVGVIAHVPDVSKLFEKISLVLKPGGKLIIETTPNPYPIGKLLFPYYYLRGLLLSGMPKYNKNRLKISALLQYAATANLEVKRSIRYSFPLPGMSHWPQSLKLRYTLFTLNNRLFSRFGSEHIYLMTKNSI